MEKNANCEHMAWTKTSRTLNTGSVYQLMDISSKTDMLCVLCVYLFQVHNRFQHRLVALRAIHTQMSHRLLDMLFSTYSRLTILIELRASQPAESGHIDDLSTPS